MSRLREAGLVFVGMSSVGPSIAIITGKERSFVEKVIRGLGLSIAVETGVDNEGLKVAHTC
jgi:beta-ribofuranosylaminobenzene 5'-phosphate synthase